MGQPASGAISDDLSHATFDPKPLTMSTVKLYLLTCSWVFLVYALTRFIDVAFSGEGTTISLSLTQLGLCLLGGVLLAATRRFWKPWTSRWL